VVDVVVPGARDVVVPGVVDVVVPGALDVVVPGVVDVVVPGVVDVVGANTVVASTEGGAGTAPERKPAGEGVPSPDPVAGVVVANVPGEDEVVGPLVLTPEAPPAW
jgi:hypothetical protein